MFAGSLLPSPFLPTYRGALVVVGRVGGQSLTWTETNNGDTFQGGGQETASCFRAPRPGRKKVRCAGPSPAPELARAWVGCGLSHIGAVVACGWLRSGEVRRSSTVLAAGKAFYSRFFYSRFAFRFCFVFFLCFLRSCLVSSSLSLFFRKR